MAASSSAAQGDDLCLVGGFNDWSAAAAYTRFTRVPGRTGRHQLTVRLQTGYISFQVVSYFSGFSFRIFPSKAPFRLLDGDPEAVPAATGGGDDGHGRNFCIDAAAGALVSIFVELRGGAPASRGLPPAGSGAAVWYASERPTPQAPTPPLLSEARRAPSSAGARSQQDAAPPPPRRAAPRKAPCQAPGTRTSEVRLLADVAWTEEARLISQASAISGRLFPHAFSSGRITLLVDASGATVLGYVVCDQVPNSGREMCLRLNQVAVLEEHQGKGLGRMLVEWAISQAQAAALPYVNLDALKNAVPFYEALGFYKLSPELEEVMPFYEYWPMELEVEDARGGLASATPAVSRFLCRR